MTWRVAPRRALVAACVPIALGTGCSSARLTSTDERDSSAARHPSVDAPPTAPPSAAFISTWMDGTAEISTYRARVARYGELRDATVVFIYVTEPFDRVRKLKDDAASGSARVDVLKLNATMTFVTGVYPYSVMTSVFAPVATWAGSPRFTPIKVSLSAQEWCGHVFHAIWPGRAAFHAQLASYFATDGERVDVVATPPGTLYEDGLLIQLRELDGPFADGGHWHGALVPSLWRSRTAHRALAPGPASIERSAAHRAGRAVTRFRIRAGAVDRSVDVEAAWPHRVLGWTDSTGESGDLVSTERLTYWELHRVEDQGLRTRLGLDPSAPVLASDGQ